MKQKGERDLALIIGMTIVLIVIIGILIITMDLSSGVADYIREGL